jgi:predicted TIM-barrel fold metal-dependent hydrolase
MFAVDYAGGGERNPNIDAVRFIETAPICDHDKEKIFHVNAEKLLRL